ALGGTRRASASPDCRRGATTMTGPEPLVLSDAWIERMLLERAGSAAPIHPVTDLVSSIATTSQRTAGRRPLAGLASSRARLLLVAATLTVAGVAAALIGSGL